MLLLLGLAGHLPLARLLHLLLVGQAAKPVRYEGVDTVRAETLTEMEKINKGIALPTL